MQKSNVPPEIRVVLQSLNDPEKLMGAVLDHALINSGAVRGMIFDREQMVRSVNYSHNEKVSVWKALEGLLVYGLDLITRSSEAFFTKIEEKPERSMAMAGVLAGAAGNLAVLALERETSFTEAEIASFAEWLDLASMPVAVSTSHARLSRMVRRDPLPLRDLNLAELAEIPNVYEVEMMLIADAMRRNGNNKGRAAEALGISRENLRRKLQRH